MPDITPDNDPHVFTMSIKDKGRIYVDGWQMQAELMSCDDPEAYDNDPQKLVDLVSECAWCEKGQVSQFKPAELIGVGLRVLKALNDLGNAPGLSQPMRQPTATSLTPPSGAKQTHAA